ncbi:MAG: sigma 54-interacting transcriptional regulator [Bacteroidia bacterium]|nr:sigma 54-interacting transcriptional regulator [Bacteroidia bacterium]MDW8089524.1 sigma 54-interacting transcriptional regulator [Bacteroidia bacterium]
MITETPREVARRFRLIGEDPLLLEAVEIAMRVAPTDVPVLILGENGTGKEIFAHILHQLSRRRDKPLLAINCGAIPEGTIDSELFGHEKGAFTSAYESRKGYFEVANGGSLFLDEIGEMPLGTQARLLRVLETGEFLRVGSSKIQKTDVRVIAATNRNLVQLIQQGKFREDLYYRLNTITLHIPPLRERGQDIERLFDFFAEEFARQYKVEPVELEPDAVRLLYEYPWPGNVRELRHLVERITVIEGGRRLSRAQLERHLPARETRLPMRYVPPSSATSSGIGAESSPGLYAQLANLEHRLIQLSEGMNMIQELLREIGARLMASEVPRLPAPASAPSDLNLENNEQRLIQEALQRAGGNRKLAARLLDISERTLYRKMERYGLRQTVRSS